MLLRIEGLSAAYDGTDVLRGIDLEIPAGQLLCVLGPSGGGKSTLLRVIAGLEEPRAGRIELDGRDLAGVPAARARRGTDVPGLRAVPAPRRGRERGLRPAHARAVDRRRDVPASASCWSWWACPGPSAVRCRSCRVVSSSAWPWRGHWHRVPAC